MTMHRLANPARFVRYSSAAFPWLAGVSAVLLAVGLIWGLFVAPEDYQQGGSARIMFVHVPSAWMAMFIYGVMALASAVGLIWRHPLADLVAKASAPIGAGFTVAALVTGSLWGQPTWGTWWVWDARLTSVLVLLFLYLGYMAIWQAFEDPNRGARAAAILALVGFVNVPIIKFSVDWWNTLHQGTSITAFDAPTIHVSILVPLLVMALGFTTYYFTVLIMRVQREILSRKIRSLRLLQVQPAEGRMEATPQRG